MSIDQLTLANRLRNARTRGGQTQDDVAAALNVPRTAIAQIEAGRRSVSSLELSQLAKLYRVPIDAFFLPEAGGADAPAEQVFFRADAGVADSPDARAEIERTIELCREGMRLDQLLGRRSRLGPPAYDFSAPTRKHEAIEQGTRAAEEARRRLELGDAPLGDMADLLSAQEIWAAAASLRDDVSGVFLKHPELGMLVLVNAQHTLARQRFSYAHEFAHAMFDRDHLQALSTVSAFENRGDLREVRANAFAAAFLMPADGVESVLRFLNKGTPSRVQTMIYDQAAEENTSPPIQAEERATPGSQTITCKDVALLAHHFGVSYLASAYRLRNLNLINQGECEALIGQESSGRAYLSLMKMDDFDEPDPTPNRELNAMVAYLAIEAYRREEISRGRMLELSKLLGISGAALLRVASQTTGE